MLATFEQAEKEMVFGESRVVPFFPPLRGKRNGIILRKPGERLIGPGIGHMVGVWGNRDNMVGVFDRSDGTVDRQKTILARRADGSDMHMRRRKTENRVDMTSAEGRRHERNVSSVAMADQAHAVEILCATVDQLGKISSSLNAFCVIDRRRPKKRIDLAPRPQRGL